MNEYEAMVEWYWQDKKVLHFDKNLRQCRFVKHKY
jgi:hypothetical protein